VVKPTSSLKGLACGKSVGVCWDEFEQAESNTVLEVQDDSDDATDEATEEDRRPASLL